MAITRVGGGSVSVGTSGTFNITLPGVPAENDIVLAFCAANIFINQSGLDGEGGIASTGYTTLAGSLNGMGGGGYWLGWKRLSGSPDSVVSFFGKSGVFSTALAVMYRGVDTTTAFDAAIQTATNTTGMPDAPANTTVTDGAWRVIAGAIQSEIETFTAPSGFGNLLQLSGVDGEPDTDTQAFADKEEATAGALDPAVWGGSASNDWFAAHILLRPAVAAPGGNHINMLLLGVG
jgi:hypothetical protein